MKNKENAQKDFVDFIKKSWTYNKMTLTEQCDCIRLLLQNHRAIRGTYSQRWDTMNALYFGFLAGLGYLRNPTAWREEKPENIPFSQS